MQGAGDGPHTHIHAHTKAHNLPRCPNAPLGSTQTGPTCCQLLQGANRNGWHACLGLGKPKAGVRNPGECTVAHQASRREAATGCCSLHCAPLCACPPLSLPPPHGPAHRAAAAASRHRPSLWAWAFPSQDASSCRLQGRGSGPDVWRPCVIRTSPRRLPPATKTHSPAWNTANARGERCKEATQWGQLGAGPTCNHAVALVVPCQLCIHLVDLHSMARHGIDRWGAGEQGLCMDRAHPAAGSDASCRRRPCTVTVASGQALPRKWGCTVAPPPYSTGKRALPAVLLVQLAARPADARLIEVARSVHDVRGADEQARAPHLAAERLDVALGSAQGGEGEGRQRQVCKLSITLVLAGRLPGGAVCARLETQEDRLLATGRYSQGQRGPAHGPPTAPPNSLTVT